MTRTIKSVLTVALAMLAGNAAAAADDSPDPHGYRDDALSFAPLVNERYAYLDRLGGQFSLTPVLRREAEAVHDTSSLLRFLERAIALLADHHAITGSSFHDSWALVPSYADLWVEEQGGRYIVVAVRSKTQAAELVEPGDEVFSVGDVPVAEAIAAYWRDLGIADPDTMRRSYAARVLLAGRRDRHRRIGMRRGETTSVMTLPSLYSARDGNSQPVTIRQEYNVVWIRFNDRLGDDATISAFDAAMALAPEDAPLILDLTDTASGGNSTVARAVLGWFVDRPRPYQVHVSPEEERATGIARMWAEFVLPRTGKHHRGPATLLLGRWTGSMGEGLAVGFDALGFAVCGAPMAGLLGAIEDNRLGHSGIIVKLPTERLTAVSGEPREEFQPRPLDDPTCSAISAGH